MVRAPSSSLTDAGATAGASSASSYSRSARSAFAATPASEAMAAAVIAETFARTGKPDEARVLLETYQADDASLAELRPALLRAQVWTYFALTKRGLARKAMDGLVALDPNHLGPFMDPKASPDLQKIALSALEAGGYQMRPKTKMRMSR